jgi:muramoyltetrapeptide carboxypeptidase
MHDNEIPFGQNEIQLITEITKELNIPIAFEFCAGHQKDNRTLVLGSQVSFEVNDTEIKLTFD